MMRHFLIYALIDPRTGQIRYVGRSCKGLRRARASAKENVGYKGNWIQKLASQGKTPEITVLQECRTYEELLSAEVAWISALRPTGLLTNISAGGRDQRPFARGEHNPSKRAENRLRASVRAKERADPATLSREARQRWERHAYRTAVVRAIRQRCDDPSYCERVTRPLRDYRVKNPPENMRPIVAVRDGTSQTFPSLHSAARALHLHAGNICKVLRGQRTSAGGYLFAYLDSAEAV